MPDLNALKKKEHLGKAIDNAAKIIGAMKKTSKELKKSKEQKKARE